MAFQRLESFGQLRNVDSESRTVTSVISTGDIARDGAIIDPKGWEFDNYDRNPVVLWQHDDNAMPFARTVERIATEKELVAKAEFDLEDPVGASVFRKIQNGYINATSVRWLPKETEVRKVGEGKDKRDVLVFLRQELLEWSFVTVPADPMALIVRADGEVLSLEDYLPPGYGYRATPLWGPEAMRNAIPTIQIPHCQLIPDENEVAENTELRRLEGRVVSHLARRLARPSTRDLIVAGLAKATGKTEERIRQNMARGGYR